MTLDLPADFRFGAATAAYQIEGAVDHDGRGPSIWDDFCAQPGRILDGSSGAVACDSYHRYPEDIALMSALGLDSYRFSFAWPRIQPTGSGPAEAAGLDYYDRLIDALLTAGIAPAATIYHWDLPSALQDAGGWANRDTTDRFADYTQVLVDRFADRVAQWIPVNEPNIVTLLGHALGEHAPGLRLGLGALQIGHHLLLAHGKAVGVLRAGGARSVGCANNHSLIWPASDTEADRGAADFFDAIFNKFYSAAMLTGRYPEGIAGLLTGPVEQDLALIGAPLDFYGVNSYNPLKVAASSDPANPFTMAPIEGYPQTDFGWPVAPDAFRDLFIHLRDTYGEALPPIYITENGCSYAIGPDDTGAIADADRVAFYEAHLQALAQARAAGVDIRGYFAWSLLDNFEWAMGYTQRFGLVWVDFDTLARTPKASFHALARTIEQVRRRPEKLLGETVS